MSSNGRAPVSIDLSFHRLVGIRLVNPAPSDAAAVRRQIGPLEERLATTPDIVIRFVDTLETPHGVRYLGADDAAFTTDAFLVLRSKGKTPARVQIPFQQIGGPCEIVCETGLAAVPLLIPILNLTMLARGIVPLHASAFTYHGQGILVTGWAKGGKTEALLGFMSNGAEYVSDEWVYLTPDGQHMFGIAEPIRFWDWHLQELPQYWARVRRADRVRLRALRLMVQSLSWATRSGSSRGMRSVRRMSKLTHLLKQQLYIHLPPQQIFNGRCGTMTATPQKVFFVGSHDAPDITVRPMSTREIAQRMVFSLQAERQEFMTHYLKFRFAFPEHSNQLIERAEGLQRQALHQALTDKAAFAVHHPYPVSIPALFDAMQRVL